MTNSSLESPKLPEFQSEALLHQAIAGLLTRMPGIRSVQILHGAQEYGKDIVFHTEGPFGESLPCACVVKNKKITGTVESNQGARSVLLQVEQALDTPYIDGSGLPTRIHRAYVICPPEIGPSAIESIKGALARRAGQIVFLSGAALFQLFRRHWIDFFSDEYAVLERMLENLDTSSKLSAIADTASRYGLGQIDVTECKIYVQRHIGRSISSHELTATIPTGSDLQSDWSAMDFKNSLSQTSLLAETIARAQRWKHANLTANQANQLATELRQLHKNIATIQARHDKSLSRNNPNKKVRLRPQESEIYQADKTFKLLYEALWPTRVACRISQKLKRSHLPDDSSILFDHCWRTCVYLEDFLRGLQSPITSCQGIAHEFYITESSLRSSTASLLIVGSAGFGKTSFCRWNALLDAEALQAGEHGPIPVYFPLHVLSHGDLGTFEETFLKQIGCSSLIRNALPLGASGVRLYLDGLDEIPSPNRQREVVRLIEHGCREIEGIQVILTARDYVDGHWLGWLPRLELRSLGNKEISELKTLWLGAEGADIGDFDREIQKAKPLEELLRVPLLATLILLVFRQTRDLPENKARLYSSFVDLLSGGWDLSKGVMRSSLFGRMVKVMVLARLAFDVHSRGEKFFSAKDIRKSTQANLIEADDASHETIIEELLVDGIISRSGDTYFFSHFSFQEFLAAKYLIGDPEKREARRILECVVRRETWWDEVFSFFVGLCENPSAVASWMSGVINNFDISGSQVIDIFKTLGDSFPAFDISQYFMDIDTEDTEAAGTERQHLDLEGHLV